MSDSPAGAESVQDEPGTSCVANRWRCHQGMMVACQKETGASLKGLLVTKSGVIWTLKQIMTATDCNSLNKIWIHDSILKQMIKWIHEEKETECQLIHVCVMGLEKPSCDSHHSNNYSGKHHQWVVKLVKVSWQTGYLQSLKAFSPKTTY